MSDEPPPPYRAPPIQINWEILGGTCQRTLRRLRAERAERERALEVVRIGYQMDPAFLESVWAQARELRRLNEDLMTHLSMAE